MKGGACISKKGIVNCHGCKKALLRIGANAVNPDDFRSYLNSILNQSVYHVSDMKKIYTIPSDLSKKDDAANYRSRIESRILFETWKEQFADRLSDNSSETHAKEHSEMREFVSNLFQQNKNVKTIPDSIMQYIKLEYLLQKVEAGFDDITTEFIILDESQYPNLPTDKDADKIEDFTIEDKNQMQARRAKILKDIEASKKVPRASGKGKLPTKVEEPTPVPNNDDNAMNVDEPSGDVQVVEEPVETVEEGSSKKEKGSSSKKRKDDSGAAYTGKKRNVLLPLATMFSNPIFRFQFANGVLQLVFISQVEYDEKEREVNVETFQAVFDFFHNAPFISNKIKYSIPEIHRVMNYDQHKAMITDKNDDSLLPVPVKEGPQAFDYQAIYFTRLALFYFSMDDLQKLTGLQYPSPDVLQNPSTEQIISLAHANFIPEYSRIYTGAFLNDNRDFLLTDDIEVGFTTTIRQDPHANNIDFFNLHFGDISTDKFLHALRYTSNEEFIKFTGKYIAKAKVDLSGIKFRFRANGDPAQRELVERVTPLGACAATSFEKFKTYLEHFDTGMRDSLLFPVTFTFSFSAFVFNRSLDEIISAIRYVSKELGITRLEVVTKGGEFSMWNTLWKHAKTHTQFGLAEYIKTLLKKSNTPVLDPKLSALSIAAKNNAYWQTFLYIFRTSRELATGNTPTDQEKVAQSFFFPMEMTQKVFKHVGVFVDLVQNKKMIPEKIRLIETVWFAWARENEITRSNMASKDRISIMNEIRKGKNVISDEILARWIFAASKEKGSFGATESLVDLYEKKRLSAVYILIDKGLPVGLQNTPTAQPLTSSLIYNICVDSDPGSLEILETVLDKIEKGSTAYYIDTEVSIKQKKGTVASLCNTLEKMLLLVKYGARVGFSPGETTPDASPETNANINKIPIDKIGEFQRIIKKYQARPNFITATIVQ